jgi:putative ubiquitin-RnfH superfamily antitoxin RatB of RatAB toxin-antitoxin module
MDDATPDGSAITVEVAYADATRQIVRRLELPAGTTVMEAVTASELERDVPVGTIDPTRLGIFSRRVSPDQVLGQGDRVEIYRPLVLDPMDARRRRARRR